MIKMIAGTYGYRINGRIEAKNSKSAPFKCDPKEEKRLVDAKVAVYVKDTDKTVSTEDSKKAKDLSEMSVDELKALATEKGITVKGKSKQSYINALLAVEETEETETEETETETEETETEELDGIDETEDAPTFGNESTVVE